MHVCVCVCVCVSVCVCIYIYIWSLLFHYWILYLFFTYSMYSPNLNLCEVIHIIHLIWLLIHNKPSVPNIRGEHFFFHLTSITFVSLTSLNTYASFNLIFPTNIESYIFCEIINSYRSSWKLHHHNVDFGIITLSYISHYFRKGSC